MKQEATKAVTLSPAAIEFVRQRTPLVSRPVTVGTQGPKILLVHA